MIAERLTELRRLSENLRVSGDISQKDVQDLGNLVNGVMGNLESLQSQLDGLSNFRHEGITKLGAIQRSLDKNLIRYISLQNVFNNIENNIDDIKISDASDLSPIHTIIRPIVASKTRFNYIFPIILVLIIMFTGIMLGSTLVILDRESPSYFRNYMTPTKKATFTFALFMTAFIILFVQLIALLLIAGIFLGLGVLFNIHNFLFSLAVIISTFALLGMVIGHLCNSEEAAIFAGVSVSSILLVFSDVILPLESMPVYLSTIFEYNPLVVSLGILKKVLVFELSFPYLVGNLLVLATYIGVMCLVLYAIFNSRRFHKKL